MSEWKVTTNYIGRDVYQVQRIKDTNKTIHSGNVEYSGGIFDTYQEAQEYADKLNKEQKIKR